MEQEAVVISGISKSPILIDSKPILNLVAEKDSEATIIEQANSEESRTINILLKENAKINYILINNQKNLAIIKRVAILEKNAQLNQIDCILGNDNVSLSSETLLQGEHSESNYQSIILGCNEQVFNLDLSSNHLASNTKSNMLTRIVLNDKAVSNHKGLVRIDKKTRNCLGYQKSETILLSEDARANSIPNLEIENNDVSCTHGATISQLDDSKIFYLTSRGISEIEAKKIMIEGFFSSILNHLSDNLKEEVENSIQERLLRVK
ncbi:MAG TPA: SufD family Fe-S cluster assembly protein [Candidatus Nanoarchaeia archaeon]|nr:SufD family Fe-S cluster assembly protein [Candidatus Nanoarchaeia archaeon]